MTQWAKMLGDRIHDHLAFSKPIGNTVHTKRCKLLPDKIRKATQKEINLSHGHTTLRCLREGLEN